MGWRGKDRIWWVTSSSFTICFSNQWLMSHSFIRFVHCDSLEIIITMIIIVGIINGNLSGADGRPIKRINGNGTLEIVRNPYWLAHSQPSSHANKNTSYLFELKWYQNPFPFCKAHPKSGSFSVILFIMTGIWIQNHPSRVLYLSLDSLNDSEENPISVSHLVFISIPNQT